MSKDWSEKVCNEWFYHRLQRNPLGLVLQTILSYNFYGVPLCTTQMTSHSTPSAYRMCIRSFVRHVDFFQVHFTSNLYNWGRFSLLAVFIDDTENLQSIEAKCTVRGCIKLPASLGPPPSIGDWGCVPSLDQFGLQSPNVGYYIIHTSIQARTSYFVY